MPLDASNRQSLEDPPDVHSLSAKAIEDELIKRRCVLPLDWEMHDLEEKREFLLLWRKDDDEA